MSKVVIIGFTPGKESRVNCLRKGNRLPESVRVSKRSTSTHICHKLTVYQTFTGVMPSILAGRSANNWETSLWDMSDR